MANLDKEMVLAALKTVSAPDGRGSLASSGLMSDITIDGGRVMLALQTEPRNAASMEALRQVVEERIRKIPGVEKALVTLTSERPQQVAQKPQQTGGLPPVKHLIAVASCKGGVGKSTTAINLAVAFKQNGLKVAVLDADVYGPSMPKLFGLKGKPEPADADGKRMKPMQRYGIEVASIGFLVDEATPVIWRGPMVMSALNQLLRDVSWTPADVMIIDMPPGTGDAQLSLAQQTPLAGAVIVSTPQDLALADARKGLAMFQKVKVPVLGIIENMSYFICDHCNTRHEIFDHGGAKAEAQRIGVPFLGEIPLDKELRRRADSGEPIGIVAPEGAHAKIYRDIAANIWAQVEGGAGRKPPPRITVEN